MHPQLPQQSPDQATQAEILRQLGELQKTITADTASRRATIEQQRKLAEELAGLRKDLGRLDAAFQAFASEKREEDIRTDERKKLFAELGTAPEPSPAGAVLFRQPEVGIWRELLNNRFLVGCTALVVIVGMLILGGGGIIQVVKEWGK